MCCQGEISHKISSGGGVGRVRGSRFLSAGAAIRGGHAHVLSEDRGITGQLLPWLVFSLIF